MTLTQFLLARYAEDEATARAACRGPWWSEGGWTVFSPPPEDWSGPHVITDVNVKNDAAHIARHDPARVLAECEAKRRIVEWHKNWPVMVETQPTVDRVDSADPQSFAFRASQQIAWMTEREYVARFGTEPPTAPILRLLALPYADHPDYRDEWKP